MRHRFALPFFGGLGLLTGCYSSPPDRAEILVNTAPPGAACLLSRAGQPLATVAPTPAIALVDPAATGLSVTCRRNGFADASIPLPPTPAAALERRVDLALVPNPFFAPR